MCLAEIKSISSVKLPAIAQGSFAPIPAGRVQDSHHDKNKSILHSYTAQTYRVNLINLNFDLSPPYYLHLKFLQHRPLSHNIIFAVP